MTTHQILFPIHPCEEAKHGGMGRSEGKDVMLNEMEPFEALQAVAPVHATPHPIDWMNGAFTILNLFFLGVVPVFPRK
jgi:hypothetical protein